MIKAGVSLAKWLAAAREMYGVSFQPSESLKAIVYFEGGDFHIRSQGESASLVQAVSEVRDLPYVALHPRQLTPSLIKTNEEVRHRVDALPRLKDG
jgi:hypothetical protein